MSNAVLLNMAFCSDFYKRQLLLKLECYQSLVVIYKLMEQSFERFSIEKFAAWGSFDEFALLHDCG